jgi:hypothetical protein
MATFLGIDGIPGGWVAVYLDKDIMHFDQAPRLDALLICLFYRLAGAFKSPVL